MRLNTLLELLEKCDVPEDVKLLSDSGWECGATEMDGVYYNSVRNMLVFTQDTSTSGKYFGVKNWVLLSKGSEEV